MPTRIALALALFCFSARGQSPVLSIRDTGFTLDGKPFPFTGVSFFNAVYNAEFNRNEETRRAWLEKFSRYGVNVIRVWAQWDNKRGFVDACPTCTLYGDGGRLREERAAVLDAILATAARTGTVVELVLFCQESWRDGIRLSDADSDAAVEALTRRLKPHRHVVFQIWNEFSHRTVESVKIVKAIDPERIVTSSPGVAGVLTAGAEETRLMDFLSPHTSRQGAGKPWIVGPAEISYLLKRYRKPVVDDEPARNGTPNFGGPRERTSPFDHVLQIWNVWRQGGYVVYHHDMFQTGAGSAAVPPSGIPDPEFSPYHRVVFEFLAQRDRYLP
ncbi:MAG TPA: hypothetical protein DEH78_04080 [Solibacterales bacterium]|nr:hypothetical protein [Bryobacterales bacterium]